MESNSHRSIFVGCDTSEIGYRLYEPFSRKIILSRDVVFDEDSSWNRSENSKGTISVPFLDVEEGTTSEQIKGSAKIDVSQVSTPFTSQSGEIQDASGPNSHREIKLSKSYAFTPQRWRNLNNVFTKLQCLHY